MSIAMDIALEKRTRQQREALAARKRAIRDFIRANPGATRDDVMPALKLTLRQWQKAIAELSGVERERDSRAGTVRYWVEGARPEARP